MQSYRIVVFDKDTLEQSNTKLESTLVQTVWVVASSLNRTEKANGNRKAYTILARG